MRIGAAPLRQKVELYSIKGDTLLQSLSLAGRVLRHPMVSVRKGLAMYGPSPRLPKVIRFGDVRFVVRSDVVSPWMARSMVWKAYDSWVGLAIARSLRPGGVFLDVGANVGYFSALAASIVGPSGCVHSWEPAPEVFAVLEDLARLNPKHRFRLNNCALGDVDGHRELALHELNTGAHSLIRDLVKQGQGRAPRTVLVEVTTLSTYVQRHNLDRASCIKIDVEGYELPVLLGATKWLRSLSRLPVIVCEVKPAALPLLGHSMSELFHWAAALGFSVVDARWPHRTLSTRDLAGVGSIDVLFVPRRGTCR